jgi:vesicle transport through interaction with t-SNAREs protein 1
VSILQDLHKQRETIVHTRETLHGADDNIGKSRRILASMAKRAMQNKVMLGAVIGILIMCIFLIIVVKTRHKK